MSHPHKTPNTTQQMVVKYSGAIFAKDAVCHAHAEWQRSDKRTITSHMSLVVLFVATRSTTAEVPSRSNSKGELQPQVEADTEDTLEIAITKQTGEEAAVDGN